MFNHINIEVVPSRLFRYFIFLSSAVSIGAACSSSIPDFLKLILSASVVMLALFAERKNTKFTLTWYPDKSRVKFVQKGMPVEECIQAVKMHLLMGSIYLQFKTKQGKTVSYAVFPDSVSDSDYRTLKSLVMLDKLDFN